MENTTTQTTNESMIDATVTIPLNNISWYFGCVVKETEKAVKVDMMMDFATGSNGKFALVFERSCWIPKSMLIKDTVSGYKAKPFFKRIMEVHNIKPYMIEGNKKIFV